MSASLRTAPGTTPSSRAGTGSVPSNINGRDYDWSYTTPFNLSPGSYSFTVQAVDDLGLETTSNMQGRLTLNASIPGDTAAEHAITPSGTQNGVTVLQLTLAGTATDDKGVQSVRVSIRDNDSSRYLQANGSLGADFYAREATLGTPGGTSTTWTLPTINLPTEGDYSVTVHRLRHRWSAGHVDERCDVPLPASIRVTCRRRCCRSSCSRRQVPCSTTARS